MNRAFLRRVQASIRSNACRGRDTEQIGPLLGTFTRDDANPFLNYAIPDEGAEPTSAEVRALVAAYRKRNRTPRLEYIPALAPSVEAAVATAGFEVGLRLPLMTVTAAADLLPSAVAGIELVAPSTEAEYRAAASVQWEAYAESGEVPARIAASLRRTAEAGGVVMLARDSRTREPAGAGLVTVPHDGLAELTSVGVAVTFRRRGIAQAMGAWLALRAFELGMTGVFLMAEGEPEARIYARAGFERQSEVLVMSRT